MRLFAALFVSTLMGLLATACATSNASGSNASGSSASGNNTSSTDGTDARQPKPKDGAEKTPTATAGTPTPLRPTGATFGPLPVEGKALVGAWRGKDARDIIGTLNFCEDGRAKAIVNGERIGAKGGSLLTWTVTKVGPGEAKIELVASANEVFSPFLIVAKRTGEAEMMVAAVTGSVTSVETAPAEDRVNLERVSTSPTCD